MFEEHEEDSFLKKDKLNDGEPLFFFDYCLIIESQHGLELRILSIVGGILILAALVYVVVKTMRSHVSSNLVH